MDRLLISLLNTVLDDSDLLETPLGAARWWAGVQGQLSPTPFEPHKPRFDAALCRTLASLREAVRELLAGGRPGLPLAFRGDASDGVLCTVTHAAWAAVESGAIDRIRHCRGCARYFFDTTKNGSRRWCSLRCMERARAPRRRTISR